MRAIEQNWQEIALRKVSKYGLFSGPNAGKHGPKITPYLDTFHTV